MGYYIEMRSSDFYLPKEKYDEAYKAACEINNHNEWKSGGTYCSDRPDPLPEGPNEWQCFSWVDWDYPEKCKDIISVFEEFGFEVHEDGAGIIGLNYNSKTGDEEVLLHAIAPYVKSGSTLESQGEDGEHWRYIFVDGRMETQFGKIVYE